MFDFNYHMRLISEKFHICPHTKEPLPINTKNYEPPCTYLQIYLLQISLVLGLVELGVQEGVTEALVPVFSLGCDWLVSFWLGHRMHLPTKLCATGIAVTLFNMQVFWCSDLSGFFFKFLKYHNIRASSSMSASCMSCS